MASTMAPRYPVIECVLADGAVVGRILKVHAAPVGSPWMWTLAFEHYQDRTPTHGYAATPETRAGHDALLRERHARESYTPKAACRRLAQAGCFVTLNSTIS